MAKQEQMVTVHGRRIRVSNLQKLLYPRTGTTKGDVIAYYSAVAATMLPHCEGRPATRKRWPDGVGEDGTRAFFFQKDLGDAAPDWVETGQIQHKDHVNTYPLVNDEATLVWLAQLAALEIHVPQWRFGASGTPANPDRRVFDLDRSSRPPRLRRALRGEARGSLGAARARRRGRVEGAHGQRSPETTRLAGLAPRQEPEFARRRATLTRLVLRGAIQREQPRNALGLERRTLPRRWGALSAKPRQVVLDTISVTEAIKLAAD